MLDALVAEAMKLRRHKATGFLIWIYPIVCILFFLITIAVGLSRGPSPGHASVASWINDTTTIWGLPGRADGRYLIAAFVAVVFAGEYGWNTWKLIVPHRARLTLMASKYVITCLLFVVTFTLTAVLTILLKWISNSLTGDAIPAGITLSALFDAHAKWAMVALFPALMTIGYTSLAAVLTRSTIAALIVGIVATTLEQLLVSIAPLLSAYSPSLVWGLFHALPGYHLNNLGAWIGKGVGLTAKFPDGSAVALSWGSSLAVVLAWLAALVGGTLTIFRRQDIN